MATSGQGDLKNQSPGRAGSVPESFKNRGKMSIEGGAWMRVWEITQRVDVGAHTQRTRGSVVAPPLGEGARSLCPPSRGPSRVATRRAHRARAPRRSEPYAIVERGARCSNSKGKFYAIMPTKSAPFPRRPDRALALKAHSANRGEWKKAVALWPPSKVAKSGVYEYEYAAEYCR